MLSYCLLSTVYCLLIHHSSFVTESDHRVYLRRAARRDVAGERGRGGEHRGHDAEDERVCRRDAVEDARHDARQRERARESECESDDDEQEALPDDEPQYVARLRAEREAYAYLVRALR